MACAAAKGNIWSASILSLLFNAVNIPNVAIASGQANLFVSLHTASPTVTGNQNAFEATYGSYQRAIVPRTSGSWVLTGESISPVANIVFPTSTGSPSETETYFAVGTQSGSGQSGELLYFGPIAPTMGINAAGITPTLTTGTTVAEQ